MSFSLKIIKFWNLFLILPLLHLKCWCHQRFWLQNFFWCNFEKLVWLPRFGTSFSILTSLLKILRGGGHFDPSPRLPFSKKPKLGRVKATSLFSLQNLELFRKRYILIYINMILRNASDGKILFVLWKLRLKSTTKYDLF